MSNASRRGDSQWAPPAGPEAFQNNVERSTANAVAGMGRIEELQAENTRLQALICYLLHINEELRQKNTNNQQVSATNAA